jgi:coenzyme PQQ precursor peptide PqqA
MPPAMQARWLGRRLQDPITCSIWTIWRYMMMKWEQPTATDLRFGFEITMYIANR